MAILILTIACPLGGMSVPSLASRSCPAAIAKPHVGTLASADSCFILTLTLFAVGPLAGTLENRVMRFPSRAFSSGIAYATGEHLRHQVVHCSLLNVIFLSFPSILGYGFLSHVIPRMTSWFWRFAPWTVSNSLWLLMSIGTFVICVTGPISRGFPSAREVSPGFFALIILIPSLLQTSLSMKSSVPPQSIMALIVTDSFPPCTCILTILWLVSCSSVSV